MIGSMTLGAVQEAASLLIRVGLADLASWEEAGVSFAFVFGILIIGYLLERFGVGLHD